MTEEDIQRRMKALAMSTMYGGLGDMDRVYSPPLPLFIAYCSLSSNVATQET